MLALRRLASSKDVMPKFHGIKPSILNSFSGSGILVYSTAHKVYKLTIKELRKPNSDMDCLGTFRDLDRWLGNENSGLENAVRLRRPEGFIGPSFREFVRDNLRRGTELRADDSPGYHIMAVMGRRNIVTNTSDGVDPAHVVMSRVHRDAPLLDRW